MPSAVSSFQPLTGPCHCGLEEVCSPLNLTLEQLEGNKTIHLPGNISLNQVWYPEPHPEAVEGEQDHLPSWKY